MEKIKCFGFDMDYTLAGTLRSGGRPAPPRAEPIRGIKMMMMAVEGSRRPLADNNNNLSAPATLNVTLELLPSVQKQISLTTASQPSVPYLPPTHSTSHRTLSGTRVIVRSTHLDKLPTYLRTLREGKRLNGSEDPVSFSAPWPFTR